jgi:hypothetical protein
MPINLLEQAGEFLQIPLQSFADGLPYNAAFPYRRTASLAYLIEYLEAKQQLAKGSAHTIQAAIVIEMKRVQDRLLNNTDKQVWEDLSALIEIFFPEFLEGNAMGFASVPFARDFIYQAPGMIHFQDDEQYSIQLQKTPVAGWASSAVVQAGGLILNTFYGQQFDFSISDLFAIENTETGIVSYKRLQASTDYFRIHALKELPKIDAMVLRRLLENFEDTDLWLHHLPPDHFQFEGIFFGRMLDVTVSEVNARLKERLFNYPIETGNPQDLLSYIEQELRNYLKIPGLRFGVFQLPGSFSEAIHLRGSLLGKEADFLAEAYSCRSYKEVIRIQHPSIIEDIKSVYDKGKIEQTLLEQGLQSLITAPLLDERGQVMGVIELAAPVANQLNAFTLLQMKGLFSLFNSGFSRFRRRWEKQLNEFIQAKFTSIHQSVRWKFEEVAAAHLKAGKSKTLKPILFKDLVPLYGQADVVGSTVIRNAATRNDLTINIKAIIRLLNLCLQKQQMVLLDSYLAQAESYLKKLDNDFSAADETVLTAFIKEDIHPFLEQLADQQNGIIRENISEYFKKLDREYRMIYQDRQRFDDSMMILIQELSRYMEREEKAMQSILPHYFNLYRTDGIEYNIFLGQSLLRDARFSDYHRKNFELWQLQSMIGMTRMVTQLRKKLPMPLQTAQLIFAYGSTLSIQFKMDEKQFDVGAGLDINYQILKKRIDKATINETKERLTRPGYIAIVYLQAREEKKYLNFLNYLARENYLDNNIERFNLAPMQGVTGLKALRAKVL